jgi:5-methylcytosine-specific restriction endonuclease McrA
VLGRGGTARHRRLRSEDRQLPTESRQGSICFASARPEFRTAKIRGKLLREQRSLCPGCKDETRPLADNGTEKQVDHKWTTDEAANAVLAEKIDLIGAYNRLWGSDNSQAVHAACSFGRNKKESVPISDGGGEV